MPAIGKYCSSVVCNGNQNDVELVLQLYAKIFWKRSTIGFCFQFFLDLSFIICNNGVNELLSILHNALSLKYGKQFSSYLALFCANAILLTDKTVTNELQPFFGHYNTSVRKNALKTLSYFNISLYFADDDCKVEEKKSFVDILLDAEKTPLTLESYRDRIMLLQKLSYCPHKNYIPSNIYGFVESSLIFLKELYLTSSHFYVLHTVFYHTHLFIFDINIFWPIFSGFLEEATMKLGISPNLKEQSKPIGKSSKKKSKSKKDPYVLSKRGIVRKSLVALLEVFSNFKSPKSIHLSAEIRSLYDELLQIGNVEVQKVVLKCIFKYNYKYLNPYRENFEKLVDERTFLNELVLFVVDDQNSAIVEEHREKMFPVLMRLIYGKLNTYVSKDLILTRRAAIFRFLAGCRSNELDVFMGILFAPLIEHYNCLFLCFNLFIKKVYYVVALFEINCLLERNKPIF
uniref:DRIM domain-containing protein n=1 Tax=Syphacia muris TaxID=451379 RepID=A0A0N5ASA4_9BILA